MEPENVQTAMEQLVRGYESKVPRGFEDIVAFHVACKGCLHNGITPFVIDEEKKLFYYRGLSKWDLEPGYLMDTCLAGQDTFKEWLDYFRIPYSD